MEEDDQHTRHYVALLNYAGWDKEMEMQHDPLTTERANADLIHCRELDRMQKDIELKNAEENCIAQQVEMLQLQIQLEGMQQGHSPPNSRCYFPFICPLRTLLNYLSFLPAYHSSLLLFASLLPFPPIIHCFHHHSIFSFTYATVCCMPSMCE